MMRTGFIATFFCAAMAASSVAAQVTGVVTSNTVDAKFATTSFSFSGDSLVGETGDDLLSGGAYDAVARVLPGKIEFTDGVATRGPYSYFSAATSIAVTFRNDGAAPVLPRLHSAIAPGGFGIYLADTGACGDPFLGCPGVAPGITWASVSRDNSTAPFGQDIAGVSFSFQIASDGVAIETLAGSLKLVIDPVTHQRLVLEDVTNLATGLTGFKLITPAGSLNKAGFAWDATSLMVDFPPSQGLLAPGDSRTLTYTTLVEGYSRSRCNGAACPIAYSGFGDPIGRGGGVGSVAFMTFDFGTPTFGAGVLSFPLSPVPEPAGWALMLIGAGLVGGALRRRSRRLA